MRIIEATELDAIRQGPVPRHVGCIMDGNGRWALARGKTRSEGHEAAEAAVESTVDAALDLGIEWLTLYAFSTENWNRDPEEVAFLMDFQNWLFHEESRDRYHRKGVRMIFRGRIPDPDGRIPSDCLDWIKETTELTRDNEQLTLCVAFNYGGRFELVDAVRAALEAGADPQSITPETIGRYLYEPDMPDMDLVMRTSAEHRLSNFFPWHSSYAELVFTETLWPDFRGWHLYSAIKEYQSRKRRKGAALSD